MRLPLRTRASARCEPRGREGGGRSGGLNPGLTLFTSTLVQGSGQDDYYGRRTQLWLANSLDHTVVIPDITYDGVAFDALKNRSVDVSWPNHALSRFEFHTAILRA